MTTRGWVSLVGAGPGDPELLTLRAVARLREADIVFYDALVDRAALSHAPQARFAFVGKRAGRPSIEQRTIETLLIRHARRGERVVRLKSGDPFVFGRGGEEALALAAAGVPCEIVPGVSSAFAAPALSGIPLTHRGLASAFLVVSGHAPEAWRPALESLTPGAATVVVLMGLGSRAAIAAALLARGWSARTPAAVLLSASRREAHTWRGTLAKLGRADVDSEGPGVLVVGKTVEVAAQLESLAAPAALSGGAR
jgi:uroporphyrin-III C-methyltransferase/precorrin-2 dehydrogenase/sirohydrochlorin ferrochelatase